MTIDLRIIALCGFICALFFPLAAAAQVTVQEYSIPRGHRVHDVWADAAPNAPVWFSAQGSGHLGILDPRSGKLELVPLGPGSSPHARRVWADSKGHVWVAEWNSGNLSRYEPKTGKWSTWKAPGDSPRAYAVYIDETDKVWVAEWTAQVMLRFETGE